MVARSFKLAVLALALGPVSAMAGIYQCKASGGSTVFQQTPCAGAQQSVKSVDTGGESNSNEDELVQMVLLAKVGCDTVVPDFAARSARDYTAWRSVRAAAVTRVEASAGFRAKLTESRKLLSEKSTSRDVAEMEQYCNAQVLPMLAKQGAPADRRFNSPQQTFKTFLAALRDGDRESALACFAEFSASDDRDQIASLPAEKLQETANLFLGSLVLKEKLGPLQTAKAARKDGTEHTIYFDREPNGNWKIAGI